MDELTAHFVSHTGPPLLRIAQAIQKNEISSENIATDSPCGREKTVSEQLLQISETNYITIPGVADYAIRSMGIAGIHTVASVRLMLADFQYFPSSSVMALTRISTEASANAVWLCDNNISWNERLRRFATLFLDRMKASRQDFSGINEADEDADSVITQVEEELAGYGWQCVQLPGYTQRVSTMWTALGIKDVSHFYGMTSKAIHADPTIESFDTSPEGRLRDRVMSTVYLSQGCLSWIASVKLASSWQGLPLLDIRQDVELLNTTIDKWLEIVNDLPINCEVP